jgi:hypothetical protein
MAAASSSDDGPLRLAGSVAATAMVSKSIMREWSYKDRTSAMSAFHPFRTLAKRPLPTKADIQLYRKAPPGPLRFRSEAVSRALCRQQAGEPARHGMFGLVSETNGHPGVIGNGRAEKRRARRSAGQVNSAIENVAGELR